MQTLESCPSCKTRKRVLVSRYNRLVLVPDMRDTEEARYDYSLCCGCGLFYAARRPAGGEFEALLSRFNEILGRPEKLDQNILIHSGPLNDAIRAEIDREARPWWELREAAETDQGRVVRPMLADMQSEISDLAFIQPFARIKDARVLHIRSKTGCLADMLRRVLGAGQVDVITLFPVNQYLIEKLYGLRAGACLDFERFEIPFDAKYSLIIANHMLTHAIDPQQFLRHARSKLRTGGHLYMRHEPSDRRMWGQRENLIGELRPFHFQQFDEAVLRRVVTAAGFRVVSAGFKYPNSKKSEMVLLAEKIGELDEVEPAGASEIAERQSMYGDWYDESVVALGELIGDGLPEAELNAAADRVVRRGAAVRGERVTLQEPMKILHMAH